jgi:Domain of unknown function (DUF222)
MFEEVETAVEAVREAAAVADPEIIDGAGAVRLLEAGEEIERLGGTIKLLAARRLEETRAWKREGDRSPAHYLARKTGTSVGQAVGTLKTARRLDPSGTTASALRAGELSPHHAAPITEACEADPHAERELVAKATTGSFQELRDECLRVKAAAHSDQVAHHDGIRRSRYVRAWTDDQGAGRGEWRLTPQAQAKLVARLDAEADLAANDAKAAGAPLEARDRYLADGLERLATTSGDGQQATPQVVLHLNLDHTAARRGHAEPGETCEIAGVAPIPAATALAMSTEALAYAVLRDGTDVTHVSRLGRSIPKTLRVALEARDQVCPVQHCDVDHDLEIHHIQTVDDNGPTSLENCLRPCKYHHYLCTHHGWRFERESDGNWQFLPPARRDRSPPDEMQLAV